MYFGIKFLASPGSSADAVTPNVLQRKCNSSPTYTLLKFSAQRGSVDISSLLDDRINEIEKPKTGFG